MCMFSVFQCNLPTLTHTNNNVQHTACNMQHATCTLRFIDFRETMRCCFGSLLLPILFFLISVGYWWSPFISLLHYFDAPLSNMKISAVCTFFFFSILCCWNLHASMLQCRRMRHSNQIVAHRHHLLGDFVLSAAMMNVLCKCCCWF